MVPGPYLIQRLDHGFAVGPALPGGEPGEVDPRFVCQNEDDARAARALPGLVDLAQDIVDSATVETPVAMLRRAEVLLAEVRA